VFWARARRPGRGYDTPMPDAIFIPEGDTFVPTDLARSPWGPNLLHGGPPAGLLARAIEHAVHDTDKPAARDNRSIGGAKAAAAGGGGSGARVEPDRGDAGIAAGGGVEVGACERPMLLQRRWNSRQTSWPPALNVEG